MYNFNLSPATSTIREIASISEVEALEAQKDESLFVFDIDDTLTILNDPAFQRPNFKNNHCTSFTKMMDSLSLTERVVAFTMPLLTTPGKLIESESPSSIQKLQKNGVKTIALTAAMGGKIEKTSIENRRFEELKRVGIDFSDSFPDLKEIIFPNFDKAIYGKPPIFNNGILFTNESDKGKVLVEFLKKLDWKPKKIIFVDDRLDHLQSVEKALRQYESTIEYIGLHYQTNPKCYQIIDKAGFEERWTEIISKTKKILLGEQS